MNQLPRAQDEKTGHCRQDGPQNQNLVPRGGSGLGYICDGQSSHANRSAVSEERSLAATGYFEQDGLRSALGNEVVFQLLANLRGRDAHEPFLLPGVYTVTATAEGFTRTERRDVRVDAGDRITVDLQMRVGTASATVEVSSASTLMETTNSDISQLIPREVVTEVASSIYRNAANFVRLASGVTGQSQGTYISDNQTAISINGGGGVQGGNEWVLDGMPDVVPLSTGSIVVVPTVDSVEEMKVNATILDASLGRTTGGAVVTVTKAGTNKVHGTLYGFGRWKG